MLECFPRLIKLIEAREPFASIAIVHAKGHSPQGVGARALVGPHGLIEGTVGGGNLEARAIAHARSMLSSSDPRSPRHELVTWNLQRELEMSCGGEISLFFEVFFRHDWQIAVFGAGHVAQKLIPILLTLDCRVVCIDTRAEWLDRLPSSPKLQTRRVEGESPSLAMAGEAERISSDSFVLLMTQGHGLDAAILKALLATRLPPFVGAIGSDVKGQALRREVREAGVPDDVCERIHCPLGLPLGSNDPAEIAVSMTAQLLQMRDRIRGSRW